MDLVEDLICDTQLDVLGDPIVEQIAALHALRSYAGIKVQIKEHVVVQRRTRAVIAPNVEQCRMPKTPHPDGQQMPGLAPTRPTALRAKSQRFPGRVRLVVTPAREHEPHPILVAAAHFLDKRTCNTDATRIWRNAQLNNLDVLPGEVVQHVAHQATGDHCGEECSLPRTVGEPLVRQQSKRALSRSVREFKDRTQQLTLRFHLLQYDARHTYSLSSRLTSGRRRACNRARTTRSRLSDRFAGPSDARPIIAFATGR